MNRFERVKEILSESTGNSQFGAHGPFWVGQTRDEFVDHVVFGRKLLVVGDSAESNLVKALKGEPPFGVDTGAAGAIFRRMPAGFPPVSMEEIAFIEAWIEDGCPEDADVLAFNFSGGDSTDAIHNAYWRDFDDWAMFQSTPAVSADVNDIMERAPLWMAYAKDEGQEGPWSDGVVAIREQVSRIAALHMNTLKQHYGEPVQGLTALDSYEKFGADTLPEDNQRPADPRHRMNGPTMWFFWSAFVDACIRDEETADVGVGLARLVLVGLANDGLFRGRFQVLGFSTEDPVQTKRAIREYALSVPREQSQEELRRRFAESGF